MKILLAGGLGFIGQELAKALISNGHRVKIIDNMMYGLDMTVPEESEFIWGSILDVNPGWLTDVDAVVNLAGFSNDPLSDWNPQLAFDANTGGASLLASHAGNARVPLFIQASSCSIYDKEKTVSSGAECPISDEDTPVNPTRAYSASKYQAEQNIEQIARKYPETKYVIVRKGTVCGVSSRMRLDLMINTMVKSAFETGCIFLNSPDPIYRPILDIQDAVRAYMAILKCGGMAIPGLYNVVGENVEVGQVARAVCVMMDHAEMGRVEIVISNGQNRNYNVAGWRFQRTYLWVPNMTYHQTIHSVIEWMRERVGQFGNRRDLVIQELEQTRFYNIRGAQEARRFGYPYGAAGGK